MQTPLEQHQPVLAKFFEPTMYPKVKGGLSSVVFGDVLLGSWLEKSDEADNLFARITIFFSHSSGVFICAFSLRGIHS